MAIDIYHTRRGHYNRCVYYKRDESNAVGDLSQWVSKEQPSGFFYGKEISPKNNQANQLGNVIMLDRNSITLETSDKVEDISRGCVVRYRNANWLVESVQFSVHLKETEFGKDEYTTYISLVR